MTVTIVGAPAPRRPVQGRHTVLVLGGDLDTASLPKVWAALRAAVDAGAAGVVLDVAAVQRCDREGLLALAQVRGRDAVRRSCIVDVVGVRWMQFLAVLAADTPRDVETTRALIRELRRPNVVEIAPP